MNEKILGQFSDEVQHTLKLYDQDEPFVPYIRDFQLNDSPPKSPEHGKILGSGESGKVYEFENDFVVKYTHRKIFEPYYSQITKIKILDFAGKPRREWLEKVLDIIHLSGQVEPEEVLNSKLQKYDPEEIMTINSDISIRIPIKDIKCKVSKPYSLFLQKVNVNIEEGDYVCVDTNYSEFLIGAYLNQKVSSMHFISTIGFISDNEDEIYLEKAGNSLSYAIDNGYININSSDMKAYLFTIMIHIFILSELGMSHNDLHRDNILVKETPNRLMNSLFLYNIRGTKFYVPAPRYILKIIDFGYAQKYTHPRILRYQTLHHLGSILPAFNTSGMYDLSFILCIFGNLNDITYDLRNNIYQHYFGSINVGNYGDCRPVSEALKDLPKLDISYFKEIFKEYLIQEPGKGITHATDFDIPT